MGGEVVDSTWNRESAVGYVVYADGWRGGMAFGMGLDLEGEIGVQLAGSMRFAGGGIPSDGY